MVTTESFSKKGTVIWQLKVNSELGSNNASLKKSLFLRKKKGSTASRISATVACQLYHNPLRGLCSYGVLCAAAISCVDLFDYILVALLQISSLLLNVRVDQFCRLLLTQRFEISFRSKSFLKREITRFHNLIPL